MGEVYTLTEKEKIYYIIYNTFFSLLKSVFSYKFFK